jgi:hypothetical protein
MSAVLLAVFEDIRDADRVRTRLVSDGFPTDRVELTAQGERGRAGVQPGSPHQQFRQYFRTLLTLENERVFAELLAQRVEDGTAVAIAVHPRGQIETRRAAQILESEGAQEVVGHDLENQSFEHASSNSDGYWVRHFVPDNPSGADCIYCRLFPGHRH